MHIDPYFDDTSETTILKNVGDSSKLTRKGEKALKNEPIAVEDNLSLANCGTLLHNILICCQPSSIYIPAILMMIRMQRAIPYSNLTQTLSYKDVLPLKILDLDDKTVKGVDFYSRYKWLKHFSSVELRALLLLICYLLDLINLNLGCRPQDPLISRVESELKHIAEESKGACSYDLHVEERMLKFLRRIRIKRLYGSHYISFQNLESVRQGKLRNSNGLPPSRGSCTGHSKTFRTEQTEFVRFEKALGKMQKILEETRNVEVKESAFGNETHICQGTGDYSQKRKNAPAEIVGSVFSNKPGNTFSRNINNLTVSFMANTKNNFNRNLISVQSSSISKQSVILDQILNPALSSRFLGIIRGRILHCTKWDLDAKRSNEYKRSTHSFPMESGTLLLAYWITDLIILVGWLGHDLLISRVESELKHIAEESKGASSYDLHVEERMLKILRRIRIKRLYGSNYISFQDLESVRQGKLRKSIGLPLS